MSRQAGYSAKWYAANRDTQKQRVIDRKKALREWIIEYKSHLKCERCPENYPACLEFHHRDPTGKVASVSQMIANGIGKDRILAEIQKCDVLCANCHRKQHASEA